MKAEIWKTIILNNSYKTALENMEYDEILLNSLEPYQRVRTVLCLEKSRITLSYKQTCPKQLNHLDHSNRITGEG